MYSLMNYFIASIIVIINNIDISISDNINNVTKRYYKPVEKFSGKGLLDPLNFDLNDNHVHIRFKRQVKRKHKNDPTTKKKLPRTTRVKTSKVWTIRTKTTTTIRPLKYNDSLRKCHRRKLMNIAVGNDKLRLEDFISKEENRKIYHEIMKPWNVVDGPKNPAVRINRKLKLLRKLNFTQVHLETHDGYNLTMPLLQFKRQRPSYLVNWNIRQFQIYNTSIQTKFLHQGRLSLNETALNPNLTVFDLWWNDTLRNLDTRIRTIGLNKSHIYRIKYPRRQDRGHRPTYEEKEKARLSLLKYYIGTTPGETIPTRYLNKAMIPNRYTPMKRLSKKILSKQKKDRLKRINKERRRRRILRRKGFKVTNIPTPKATVRVTKIRRQDPLLRANLSFFDRDISYHAFYDLSKMMASEFDDAYEIVDVTKGDKLHRKQKTPKTTVFYDANDPTTEKPIFTMKKSKQKLGLEKKLLKLRAEDSKEERFQREYAEEQRNKETKHLK